MTQRETDDNYQPFSQSQYEVPWYACNNCDDNGCYKCNDTGVCPEQPLCVECGDVGCYRCGTTDYLEPDSLHTLMSSCLAQGIAAANDWIDANYDNAHRVAYSECCLDIELHLNAEIFEWPPVLADLLDLICPN